MLDLISTNVWAAGVLAGPGGGQNPARDELAMRLDGPTSSAGLAAAAGESGGAPVRAAPSAPAAGGAAPAGEGLFFSS